MTEPWTPVEIGVVVAVLIAAAVSSVLFAWGLMRAGAQPIAAMLTVTLSLLTFAALAGGLVMESDTALALAGTGFGALAGAVSAVFSGSQAAPPPEEPPSV